MNELREQIARAQRRLNFEQFLARCVWCLSAALAAALVAIVLPRLGYDRGVAGKLGCELVLWCGGGGACRGRGVDDRVASLGARCGD